MRRLVIFVIETKSDKENSDGVYLRETLEHLYEYDRSNTIVKFVFMNGKGNYNKSSVVNKIDSYIKDSTSQSYGMSKIHVAINNAGAKIVVDEATGQNYAEWQTSILHRMGVVLMNKNHFDFKDLIAFGTFIIVLLTFVFTFVR